MRIKTVVASTLAIALILLGSTIVQLPALANEPDPEPGACRAEPLSESALITGSSEITDTSTTASDLLIDQPIPWGEQPSGDWIAGETSVSQLGGVEQDRLLGVPMDVIDWEQSKAAEQTATLSASYTYPSALDWRNFGGEDWTTPVRNQGGCGSCVAFATTSAIESRLEIAMGDPDLNPDLSEAHLFFCGSGSICTNGWYPSAAMDFARDTGIADEVCYPYAGYDQTCSVCPDWQSSATQISSWIGLTDVSDMKQALADHGPFEVTMLVYLDFYYYTEGIYEHTWGELRGAHAVTLVGYDDSEGYWIAKNSWGMNWGENGWFRIAYGDCYIDGYAYVPLVDQPTPTYHLDTSVIPEEGGTILADPSVCVIDGCEQGTEVELTATPEAGYEFTGWAGDASGSSDSIVVIIDGDMNVTANFSSTSDGGDVRIFIPLVIG